MACRGMPGVPGSQGPQGREGAKGQTGDKGAQGMSGTKGERGPEGPRGKSGPPGMMGIKGEPGIVGAQGKKGDKGEKGESVKASPSSAVPQTNWKQCVWKQSDGTDNGKIKVMAKQTLNDSFVLRLRKVPISIDRNTVLVSFVYLKALRENETVNPLYPHPRLSVDLSSRFMT